MADENLAGFAEFSFAHDDITHRVFFLGEGPPVLVTHELPGLTPAALRFGRRLAAKGFCVYLPLLFGKPGQNDGLGSLRQLCISREFAKLAAGVSAPIVDWLRALATDLSGRHGHSPVGAIGMCLTGAFVIPLILEPCVVAPVAAQPGSPFSATFRYLGIGRGPWMSQMNISDADLHAAGVRASTDGVSLLAVRFEKDRICPAERLDRLETVFLSQLVRHDLKGGSPLRPPHATLTAEYERAPDRPNEPTRLLFAEVVAFLNSRLRPKR